MKTGRCWWIPSRLAQLLLDRLRRMRSSALILALAMGMTQLSSLALSQPFQPITKLTTWYTDRTPIDLEIVASMGQGNEAHLLQPERKLRFRLERAYVDFLFRKEQPPSSSVMMSFDVPTGLPSVLFRAPPEQVDAKSDKILQLDHATSVRRTLNIRLQSKEVVELVKRASSEIRRCRGPSRGNDLFLYDKNREESCVARSFGSGTKYVAELSDDTDLLIDCSNSRATNCEVSFPFEGFAPSVSFNESYLGGWREVIERAASFLRSKQYE